MISFFTSFLFPSEASDEEDLSSELGLDPLDQPQQEVLDFVSPIEFVHPFAI